MTFRAILAGLAVVASTLVVACGDGPDDSQPTPAGTSTRVPTSVAGSFGLAPTLGGNITDIAPAHASTVPQSLTRLRNDPRGAVSKTGVCAVVSFEGLGEGNGQWFRMAVDDEEVTPKLYWFVETKEAPTGGTVCHIPADGLTPGRHTAALTVTDPRNNTARPRQLVAWAFDVAP